MPQWSRARLLKRHQWKDGVPPEPDYSRLDDQAWLHGPHQEKMQQLALEDEDPAGTEELVLDCRVEEFFQDLTEEEKWLARNPDARLWDIDIPDNLMRKASSKLRQHDSRKKKTRRQAQVGQARLAREAPGEVHQDAEGARRELQASVPAPAGQVQEAPSKCPPGGQETHGRQDTQRPRHQEEKAKRGGARPNKCRSARPPAQEQQTTGDQLRRQSRPVGHDSHDPEGVPRQGRGSNVVIKSIKEIMRIL